MTEVLSSSDWNTDYFERIRTVSHHESWTTTGTWITWKQLIDRDDISVIRLALKSGKLKHRPHEKLDHDDPEVQALDEDLRREYKWTSDSESSGSTSKLDTVEKDLAMPTTEKTCEAEETPAARASRISTEGKRAVTLFCANEMEFKQRFAKDSNNPYPLQLIISVRTL